VNNTQKKEDLNLPNSLPTGINTEKLQDQNATNKWLNMPML